MAAVALLVVEASKLTLDKGLVVSTAHSVAGLLSSKGNLLLSDNQLLKYKTLLLERPATQIKTFSSLNLVAFLPGKEEIEAERRDCEQVILYMYAGREDLLDSPSLTLFGDISSSMENETKGQNM